MKIITCDLPRPIQRLYIKRLKHMIWRWEFENFCGHCPLQKRFQVKVPIIKQFQKYDSPNYAGRKVCAFCKRNHNTYTCPCNDLGAKEALKRAKDFILRFEAGDGKRNEISS